MKYAVVSDLHVHTWSLFSHQTRSGTNSRLEIVLKELRRAGDTVRAAGGSVVVIAGDLFHTRGIIDPEVLNPVRACIREMIDKGVIFFAIPGNHDLKSRDTTELSSAIQNLDDPLNFRVSNQPETYTFNGQSFGFVPWCHTTEELLKHLGEIRGKRDPSVTDVFIHAGIDGVLSGVPGSGLTEHTLAAFGFRHIFAGHYHNHKIMTGGVVSIGATSHHNWGDVGTRAGFLMVDSDTGEVTFHDTKAPKFIDISGFDETDMEIESNGNYVRFRGPQMTQVQIQEFRDQLHKWGALGTSIEVPRVATVGRSAGPTKGKTLKESIADYVAAAPVPAHLTKEEITKRALEVLDLSQAVSA